MWIDDLVVIVDLTGTNFCTISEASFFSIVTLHVEVVIAERFRHRYSGRMDEFLGIFQEIVTS